MKNQITILLTQVGLILMFANLSNAQVHFVPVSIKDTSYCARIIETTTPNNYDINILNKTGSNTIVKKYKNTETPNWSLLSNNSIPSNDINQTKPFKSFLYNGKSTIAYANNSNGIIIAQWDVFSNQYLPILPVLNSSYLGNFDVSVNPITNQIYVSCEYVITTTSTYIYHYNGSTWVTDLSQYNPYGPSYSLNHPEIYFADSTLYIAGVSKDTMRVSRQNYTLFTGGTTMPPSASLTATNPVSTKASDYSMEGMPGQAPYFATYNQTTGNLSLSNIQSNVITFLGGINLGAGTVARLNLAFKSGTPQILLTSLNGALATSEILNFSGGSLSPGLNVSNISNTSTLNDVYLISSTDGMRNFAGITSKTMSAFGPTSIIYASNNKPTVTSSNYEDTICFISGADYNTHDIGTINFSDVDGDQVFITDIFATNQSVLPIGVSQYTVAKTQSIGGSTSYKITVINSQGTGISDLKIVYSDGYELDTLTFTNIHSIASATVPLTLLDNIAAGVTYCDNSDVIDLTKVTNPYAGTFIIEYSNQNIPSGILSVEDYTTNYYPPNFLYTDALGCVNAIEIPLTMVASPTASVTTTPADCNTNNGSATLTYAQGDASISDIYWSAGFHDSTSLSGLYAGQYLVTITDLNDCRVSVSADIDLNGITVNETVINAICYGQANGSIQLTVNGNDAPYTYLWSNGKSTNSIFNLTAGTYEVTITSASGCTMTKTYKVNQSIAPLDIQSYNSYSPDCNTANGQLEATVSGGYSPYTYQWSTGDNTQIVYNVPSGIYHVKVTDVLGCTLEKDIKLNDYNTPSIYANAVVSPSCGMTNGYIDAQLTDMTNYSSVAWSNGATQMFNSNLGGGHYICTAKTNDGCKAFGIWDLDAQKPLQNNICMLTVDSATNTNLIVWEKVQTNIDHYNIYREGSTAGQFLLIDTVSGLNHSIFNDVVASPKTHSWRYKISAVSQCGVEGPLSIAHKTIHLVISQSIGTQYNISWDKYEGFAYSTLNLWRYTSANGWELISALPSNVFSYTDDLQSIDPTGIDYMVEIAPQTPCSPDKAQDYNSSRSNKANSIMIPGQGTGVSNNSIKEYGDILPISMYPNPTNGQITILNENNGKTNVVVFDQSGKELDNFTFEKETKKNYQYLNSGVYYIRFIQENSTTVKKLIIH